jgi:predicted RNase H-like nuclease (RuvC/YqgF family)
MEDVKSDYQKEKFPKGENQNQVAFRRWLVREISAGRMTLKDALERFDFGHKNQETSRTILRDWIKQYSPSIPVTLPVMSEKERQKLEALQKQVKELEKQLENAQMKNVALETMIDVAEDQLKIKIRKKSGPKQ